MDSVSALRSRQSSDRAPQAVRLSRGLGWFSLALGIAELTIPRAVARMIGVAPRGATPWVLRAIGAREVLVGLGALVRPHRPAALWGRVAGDAMDLALLGAAVNGRRTNRPRIAGAIAAVAGMTALDIVAGRRVQRRYRQANRPVVFSVTINRPPQEVYAFYRKLSQLPQFMDYLESVDEIDRKRSRWIANTPIGTIAWEAEITDDRPGELIAWRSVEGSPVQTRGRVSFARTPGRDMTEVRVELQLGFLGAGPSTELAKFFTRSQIKGDLRRLKQVLETGEVLSSDASAHRLPHAAQPPTAAERARLEHARAPFTPHPPTAEKGILQ
jgi:uncharacterized membrane protein